MKIVKLSEGNLEKIPAFLKRGKTVVFPTDTVYGLLADATSKKAAGRISKIKKRSNLKPFPIFVKDIKMAREFAAISQNQEKFLKKSWPGKITVVLNREKKAKKIYGIDKKTIGLRIPKYGLLLNLVKQLNCPIIGTSANISGQPASTKIQEVIRQFQGQKYQPDFIIDAGNLPKSRPSKIIDLTVQPYKILRP